jgi:hypothetical protein
MPFPSRFKPLLELTFADLTKPDYLWLTYSVCGCDHDSCGWHGWVLEAIFARSITVQPTGTGDALLPSSGDSCPRCGRPLFRTAASVRFEPSAAQVPVHGEPHEDYDPAPMEYEP